MKIPIGLSELKIPTMQEINGEQLECRFHRKLWCFSLLVVMKVYIITKVLPMENKFSAVNPQEIKV
ncbi:MAG: hypothetical protein ABIH49_00275 [archaeon]